ncbi:hypothetical protein MAP00_002805 [Monascus purpureus]|nr:hypothetical protein MAP00_002805 [Monascus purpureus]
MDENSINNIKTTNTHHESLPNMPRLSTIPTSITLSSEQFERLYLSPLLHRQPQYAKQLGNPTPLALGGFVITTTPLSCCLMGWRGAGGNGIAFTGTIVFLGGGLLVITSILEFILGNTFPCVVFGTIGAFWFAFATTMTPAFNAAGLSHGLFCFKVVVSKKLTTQLRIAPYSSSTTNTLQGLSSPEFLDTYAFFYLSMAILMIIFLICATRTNAVFVLIFAALTMVFLLLTGAYWRLAVADSLVGNRLVVGAGAFLFIASILGFYMLIAQLFDSVALPIRIPVGDLSGLWDRRKKENPQQDLETNVSSVDDK